MLKELLMSIIDNQSLINIDLLEAIKPSIQEYEFEVFFIKLIEEDRSNKRIFMKESWLVSTYSERTTNTFKIFNVLSENCFNDFINGMRRWHDYENVPF